MRIFKLKFQSGLHIDSRGSGEPEESQEFIHSDTLSAAICLARSTLYPAETDPAFFDQPRFKVSSAFPYIDDVLFFPKPLWSIWKRRDRDIEPPQRKKIKEIRWVSQKLFERARAGIQTEFADVQVLPCGLAVLKEEMASRPQLKEFQAWEKTERQRVSVDRFGIQTEGEGLLFFFSLHFFSPSSGLYFLAEPEPSEAEKFRAAVDFLGDSGIGADRNSGLGHFQVREKDTEFKFSEVKHPDGWVTLSLFNPGKDDSLPDLIQKTAYGLTTRSGWINHSSVGRPPVRVFTEGSYFSAKPVGRVIPMIDDKTRKKFNLPIAHSSPRDFRAICLPCIEPVHFKENQS